MKRLVASAVAVLFLWQAVEACGPWFILRPSLNTVFWQPFVKTIPELLGKPGTDASGPPFAGMGAGGGAPMAAARREYQRVARWRLDHFQRWEPQEPPILQDSILAARRAVDAALAARPSARDAEELRLLRAKITLREAEALEAVSHTKFVTPASAPEDTLRRARREFAAYIAGARDPALVSEARGWLARCHYLLDEPHQAARIYLDELARHDSALDRTTLLTSLRIVFPYNGSTAGLADHLDEYFDTPQHALFVVNLVTNPVGHDENERQAMAAVGRKALDALERHPELFTQGSAADALALAAMRARLYLGEPAAAIRVWEALPLSSGARAAPEGHWMMGVARFLAGDYEAAEAHLLAVDRSEGSPESARRYALLGLLAVYQKLDRPVDQLIAALRYEDLARSANWEEADFQWSPGWWPYLGFLMDVSYLLDVQLTEEELRSARAALDARKPLTIELFAWSNRRVLRAQYLVDYTLAVRAARREAYGEAADLYARLGAGRRTQRMRSLVRLSSDAGSPEAGLLRRYAYGAFLADHSERVFFNDLVWSGHQRYAMLGQEGGREGPPDLLSAPEHATLVANDRAFKDAQEERWRAFLILDEVVTRAGPSRLGRRAALKAIQALDRIRTGRFGREAEVNAARTRLTAWLRKNFERKERRSVTMSSW